MNGIEFAKELRAMWSHWYERTYTSINVPDFETYYLRVVGLTNDEDLRSSLSEFHKNYDELYKRDGYGLDRHLLGYVANVLSPPRC